MIQTLVESAGQNQRAEDTAKSANEAYRMAARQLTLRQAQEAQAGAQTAYQYERQARQADAQAKVAAGEAGVAGASVEQLLASIARDSGSAVAATSRQTQAALVQTDMERQGYDAQRRDRIAGAPPANPFITGLRIGGVAAGAAGQYFGLLPKVGGK